MITAPRSEDVALHHTASPVEPGHCSPELRLTWTAHELRAPIVNIMGACELLRESPCDPARAELLLNIIDKTGARMLELIGRLLDSAQARQARLVPRPARVALADVVESSLWAVQATAHRRGITLLTRIDVPETLSTIDVDPVWLVQILVNLLSNAIRFTDQGGVMLVVRSTDHPARGTQLRFEVIDDGCGMTAEQLDAVCIRIHLGEGIAPAISRRGGSGIGLALTVKLLHLMGSELQLESAPDVGTTAWFEIPALVG